MRVLALILTIPLTAALAAALWGLALVKGDVGALVAHLERGEFPSFPDLGPGAGWSGAAPARDAAPAAVDDDGLAEIIEAQLGRASLGAGDSANGTTVERADTAEAVALLPTGQRVTVTAPEGYALRPRFSQPDGAHLGVLLTSAEALPLGLVVTDVEAMRTAKLTEKLEFYRLLADGIEGQRQEGGYRVDGVSHDARGVFYCLRARWSRERVLAAARIDRGLLVATVLRMGCGDPSDADVARLETAMRAVSPERWR